MWSSKIYSYLLTGIAAIGVITNFKCFKYIKKTFDTKGNVFYILAQESLATSINSALYLITNIVSFINEDLMKNKIGCAIHFSGIYLPTVVGPVSSFMISLRRFVQLKYPTKVPHNSEWVNIAVSAIMTFVSFYYLTYMWVNTFLDLKNFNFIEQCLGNLHDAEASKVSL